MFTGRCCLLSAGLIMERIYTALFSPVATQSTTQYRLTFTRSRAHQSHTDGGVSHSRRQPARRLGAVQGEGVLPEGHLDTRTTRRSRGIEPATLRSPADPLHLLSPMPAWPGRACGSGCPPSPHRALAIPEEVPAGARSGVGTVMQSQ